MAHDLIRLMHALFMPAAQACQATRWCPPADVYRTDAGWLVKFDLAGVRAEDLRVSIHGPRLTVQGSRRDWCMAEGHSHHSLEIAYSHFERGIDLPCDLDQAEIATEYRDGMLLIVIRTEEAKP